MGVRYVTEPQTQAFPVSVLLGFVAQILLQSCETKSGTESWGSGKASKAVPRFRPDPQSR